MILKKQQETEEQQGDVTWNREDAQRLFEYRKTHQLRQADIAILANKKTIVPNEYSHRTISYLESFSPKETQKNVSKPSLKRLVGYIKAILEKTKNPRKILQKEQEKIQNNEPKSLGVSAMPIRARIGYTVGKNASKAEKTGKEETTEKATREEENNESQEKISDYVERFKPTESNDEQQSTLTALTHYRLKAGYTMSSLAEKLGISRQTQYWRENRRNEVQVDWLLDTATALDACPFELGFALLSEHIRTAIEAKSKTEKQKTEKAA